MASEALRVLDFLLQLTHPVFSAILLCKEHVFAGEAVVVVAFVSACELFLPSFVVLLKDVLLHVLPEF